MSSLPRHVVDVDFHDAEVGHGGAQVGAHQGRQVAVEIVRRHVDLVGFGHGGDFQRLPDAVPRHVDDGHVHGIVLEIGLEAAHPEQRLAGGDRGLERVADAPQRGGIVNVELEPEEAEVVEGARHLQVALGLEVEIEVQQDADIRARAGAKRLQLGAQGIDDGAVGVQRRPPRRAAEARYVQARLTVEQEDVGLQGLEAELADFLTQRHQVLDALELRLAHDLGRIAGHAIRAAVRPVQRQAVPNGAAEQRVYRHVQGLALDVEQSVLDRRDRLLRHAAAGLPGDGVELLAQKFMGARVFAHQALRQVLDHPAEAGAAVALVVLGDAVQAVVRGQFQEREHPPPGVAVQGLVARQLHQRSLYGWDCLRAWLSSGALYPIMADETASATAHRRWRR